MRGPSAWVVAVFAVALGAAVGGSSAALDATLRPWRLGDFGPGVLAAPTGDAPKADVPESTHAFGTIGSGAEGEHEFVIGNTGSAPLTLTKGATSCSCTVSDFEAADGVAENAKKIVAPGSNTKVRLKWRGKGSGGPFRQQATVFTNDPRRPEIAFVIEGTVVPTWKAVPESIVLSQISAGAAVQATARIFTFGKDPPEISKLSTTDPQTSQFLRAARGSRDRRGNRGHGRVFAQRGREAGAANRPAAADDHGGTADSRRIGRRLTDRGERGR